MDEHDRVSALACGAAGAEFLALGGRQVITRVGTHQEVGVARGLGRTVTGRGVVDARDGAPGMERGDDEKGQPEQENQWDEAPQPAATRGTPLVDRTSDGATTARWSLTAGSGLTRCRHRADRADRALGGNLATGRGAAGCSCGRLRPAVRGLLACGRRWPTATTRVHHNGLAVVRRPLHRNGPDVVGAWAAWAFWHADTITGLLDGPSQVAG